MPFKLDPKRKLYVDTDTGETLALDQVADLVDDIIDRTTDDTVESLTMLLESGEIDADTWGDTFANIIKDTFLILALIALGGILSANYLDRIEARIRRQYGFLSNFIQEILAGQLTLSEILRRGAMYINSTRQVYWMVLDEEFGNADYTKERWVAVGDRNTCHGCLEADLEGWQPIGTYAEPGSGMVRNEPATTCEGLTACRCWKDYAE